MTVETNGRTASLATLFPGKLATGLPTEVDLAVDAASDLAVDESTALEIQPGIVWVGASATKIIET